jgi:hypothetical protein
MPRSRGGQRQGTPGKGYANRTDLMSSYDQSKPTAATGGMQQPMTTGPLPDDTPNLDTPTQYPDEPITAGLNIGAGPGPARDNRAQETAQLKKYLPMIEPYLRSADTPDSVRMLFRYIRGS